MNFLYRKATVDDLQLLIDYRIMFLLDFWGEQNPELKAHLRSELAVYYNETVADKSFISYIAFYENNVAGIGGLVYRRQPGSFKNPTGKMGYIVNMYTLPPYRRNGICSTLINLLMEEAKKEGVILFELNASKEGEHLYKKEDFVLHSEPCYRKYV
jgi:predicted acetyltransferase